MAGSFPAGNEFNVRMDAAASQSVFTNWPTPVLFSGVEIGMKIKSGLPLINNAAIDNSPVKDVYRISIPLSAQDSAGRMSWDQTAVLIAVKGYEPWWDIKHGRIIVASDGSNKWENGRPGQSYLVEKVPVDVIAGVINKLMMHQPK